jgi:integrase
MAQDTLASWSVEWLRSLEGNRRPKTLDCYRRAIRPYVDRLGDVCLDDLTPRQLLAVQNELRDAGKGPRALQHCHIYLRACLQAAVKLEVLARNPMDKVLKPQWHPQALSFWTLDEARRFLSVAPGCRTRWTPLFTILTTTGLRFSEAIALRWRDVDLDGGSLRVDRAFIWSGNKLTVQPPKSKAGRRLVSLPELAVSAFRAIPRESDPDALIFTTINGRPPHHAHLRKALKSLCHQADVPRIKLHGLRHVAAMTALKITNDPHSVQRRLGHSHVSTTIGIYGYPTQTDGELARGLDDLLREGDGRDDS